MEILKWIDESAVSLIISYLGIGLFFDAIFPKKQKAVVVDFVSRRAPASLAEFEASIITGLVETFSWPGDLDRLSIKRIFVLSILAVCLMFLVGDFARDAKVSVFANPLVALLLAVPLAVFCLPFDIFSVWVTKRIFYYRTHRLWKLPLLIVLDAIISLIPPIAMMIIFFLNINILPEFDDPIANMIIPFLILGSTYANMIGSVAISVLQVAALCAGIMARLVFLLLSKAGTDLARLREYPITVGLVTMLPVLIIAG